VVVSSAGSSTNISCNCYCHVPWGSILPPPPCVCQCNKTYTVINTFSGSDNKFAQIDMVLKSHKSSLDMLWEVIEKIKANNSDKKPYKCPVCDGEGGTKISGTIDEDCCACQGKGIVWG